MMVMQQVEVMVASVTLAAKAYAMASWAVFTLIVFTFAMFVSKTSTADFPAALAQIPDVVVCLDFDVLANTISLNPRNAGVNLRGCVNVVYGDHSGF